MTNTEPVNGRRALNLTLTFVPIPHHTLVLTLTRSHPLALALLALLTQGPTPKPNPHPHRKPHDMHMSSWSYGNTRIRRPRLAPTLAHSYPRPRCPSRIDLAGGCQGQAGRHGQERQGPAERRHAGFMMHGASLAAPLYRSIPPLRVLRGVCAASGPSALSCALCCTHSWDNP